MTSRPFDLLNESVGKEVLVVTKGSLSFRGTLKAFDVHMNVVLENAEELLEGETKKKYSKIIIRGDTVIYIAP